jgi:hypothetical protein
MEIPFTDLCEFTELLDRQHRSSRSVVSPNSREASLEEIKTLLPILKRPGLASGRSDFDLGVGYYWGFMKTATPCIRIISMTYQRAIRGF